MEVKINREIREFSESVFFGLSLRQCIFAVLACGIAVALYFALSSYLELEVLSWLCIISAAPFAALGFITYHGMAAEQIAWAWIKSEILTPKELLFKPTNTYYEACRPVIEGASKKGLHKHD
jgi:predicted acyltransferase